MDFVLTEVGEKMKGLTLSDEDVPTVHELDLEKVPAGRISKLWVVLFEDAIKPVTVPLIIAKGTLNKAMINVRVPSWTSGGIDFVLAWRRSQRRTRHS